MEKKAHTGRPRFTAVNVYPETRRLVRLIAHKTEVPMCDVIGRLVETAAKRHKVA